MALTIPVFLGLGGEFMPPLNEGTLLYMPITLPGISVTEATKYLQIQDKLLKEFPEVESVFGKVGKAETSTDPAPLSMVETRSEEHTSELQSLAYLVCRLLLEKKKRTRT